MSALDQATARWGGATVLKRPAFSNHQEWLDYWTTRRRRRREVVAAYLERREERRAAAKVRDARHGDGAS